MKNILSFDIEEHFQVSGLAAAIKRADWEKHSSRVEANTAKILDILSSRNTKATFFILGWIAQRYPQMVKRIAAGGHELASHGLEHRLAYDMSPEEFRRDIQSSLDIIENIVGQKVSGFRAPSFSLAANDFDKFEILAELGLTYDSSLFPMKHFRYGEATGIPLGPFDIKKDGRILLKEYPMTVVDFLGKPIPAGGGGYFRLYPNFFIRRNFRKANAEGRPVIVYLHPWEFDPQQPRVSGAGLGNTFRHYYGLDKTADKLDRILRDFEFGPFREFR